MSRRRRNVFGGAVAAAPVDPHLSLRGIQGAFYRLPGDPNYTVDGGTGDATFVDAIPPASKTIADAAYAIVALSAQKPVANADGTWTWGAAGTGFQGAVGLPGLFGSQGAYSVYFFSTVRTSGYPFAFSSSLAGFASSVALTGSGGNNLRHICTSAVGTSAQGLTVPVGNRVCLTCSNGGPVLTYVNGVLVNTGAVQSAIDPSMDTFALGDYGGNAGFVGTMVDHTSCVVEHSGAEVAAYDAALVAYWAGRGVALP